MSQTKDSEQEELLLCTACAHLVNSHKWYSQSEEYWNEERWECRFDDCQCIVTWTEHYFIDIGPTILRDRRIYALRKQIEALMIIYNDDSFEMPEDIASAIMWIRRKFKSQLAALEGEKK
jgi:hypothetical protein